MSDARRIAPEISSSIDPIPVAPRSSRVEHADASGSSIQIDWLSAGWKFGLGFMAAATLFGLLDGFVLYILSTQGFHLSFGLPH